MWSVILLAGGSGTRMGASVNKVLLELDGKTILRRSAEALMPFAGQMIVVCRPEDEDAVRGTLSGLRFDLAYGGATRQESVWNGLQLLNPAADYVMMHDGARCLVDADTIKRTMDSAEKDGTGVAAIPVTDTIKRVDADEFAAETPDRSMLRAVQTPQAFAVPLIMEAHRRAMADGLIGTDDASLVEHMGHSVRLTLGNKRNLKMTTPEDLLMANAYLNENRLPDLRVGQGYDVHQLVEGRKLILCGVEVPHTMGLLGHSDADVALHALMDAMLGSMAMGDIGKHFPDNDDRYLGISSMKLLERVTALLKEHHARVTNADITIVAQKPKLLPHIPQMRENVAAALGLPVERVNVKATTTEHLGFEGEQKGISAQAVVMTAVEG